MRALVGLAIGLSAVALVAGVAPALSQHRCSVWVDTVNAEPVSWDGLIADLATVDVVYLGETHTLKRHHAVQRSVINALAGQGRKLVVAMEQIQARYQPEVDRYSAGEIGFNELAKRIDWAHGWSNFRDYRQVLQAARAHGAPVVALNANPDTIRQVGREGLDGLSPDTRAKLPAEIDLDDPMYAELLLIRLQVHATIPAERLRTIYEAQVSRDEHMAAALADWLKNHEAEEWLAVVICGEGHLSHGLGTPSRVLRRMPDIKDRIVLLSESGDLVLSPAEQAMSRDVEITHDDLRFLRAPVADYVQVRALR